MSKIVESVYSEPKESHKMGLMLGGVALTMAQGLLVKNGVNSEPMVLANMALLGAQMLGAKVAYQETGDAFFAKASHLFGALTTLTGFSPLTAGMKDAGVSIMQGSLGCGTWAIAKNTAAKLGKFKDAFYKVVPPVVFACTATMIGVQVNHAIGGGAPTGKVIGVSLATSLGCLMQAQAWAAAHARTGNKFAKGMSKALYYLSAANTGGAIATGIISAAE